MPPPYHGTEAERKFIRHFTTSGASTYSFLSLCRLVLPGMRGVENTSHMAQDWCLAHGVLGMEKAEALYKRVCKRKGLQPSAHAPALSNSPTKKVRTYNQQLRR